MQLGFQSLALVAAVHGVEYFVRKQSPHIHKLWLFRMVHLKMGLAQTHDKKARANEINCESLQGEPADNTVPA